MFIVNNRKIFYIISGLLILASLVSLGIWGLNLGIDFKGGSLLEVEYPDGRPDVEQIKSKIAPLSLGDYSVRPTGDKGYIFRMKSLTEEERVSVMKAISPDDNKKIVQNRFDSIGPLLGKEAVNKSFVSVILVILCIVLFITFAFRKVSEPVSSWKYGIIAVLALLHDVIVPIGVFSILGHFHGVEIDTLFVTALLVILGFSIHDTIVVFDRVRENLRTSHDYRTKMPFSEIVGKSINETFVRSINTSLTTLLALIVLYFVGGEPTRYFSLALIVGIITGTYSSIFLGSPLLVTVEKWQNRKK